MVVNASCCCIAEPASQLQLASHDIIHVWRKARFALGLLQPEEAAAETELLAEAEAQAELTHRGMTHTYAHTQREI